ncbi:MAG: ABC transporter substrate-binding protein [Clostridiales bacterium]|jgi:peptide/nickel transport system substrate-binding protein|nr:ABC transporter substrate-binding protein [Clostridiales bacterium]
MNFRKLFMAILVLSMVFVFAACRREADTEAPPATTPPQVEQPTPGEVDDTPTPESLHIPFTTRAALLASMPDFAPSGSINQASGTRASINMLYGWDNVATNAQARRLMWEGVSTMESNSRREMFANPMVINGAAGGIEVYNNDDGSRTYRFNIYTDNVWSDGRTITAHDYVGWILLTAHPYYLEIITSPAGSPHMMGRAAFAAGDAPTMTGVRVYDEATFSVTVYADFLPFVWESFVYMSYQPMPLHAMLPGFDTQTQVRDSENGAYLTGLTQDLVTAGINGVETLVRRTNADGDYVTNDDGDYIYDLVGGTGFRFQPTVTSSAYMFESFDPSTFTIVLRANPLFSGTWDGYLPRIERVIFSEHVTAVIVDSLANAEADIVVGQGGGETINNMLTHLVEAGTHTFVNYPRNGQGFLRLHVDHGPTQFIEVRQAFKWLIDRDEFKEMFTLGHGVMVHAMYGIAHWWTQEAIDRGMHDRMIMFTFNPEEAVALLEAGGWTLDAQGNEQPRDFFGPANIRHKDVTNSPQHPGALAFEEDQNVTVLDDGRLLMELNIRWATWESAINPITRVFEALVPHQMRAVGMELTTTRLPNPLTYLSRSGTTPDPTFHLFNQGQTFDPRVWQPWNQVDHNYARSHNLTFTSDPELFELSNRLRFIEIDTDEGRNQFVETFMDVMVEWNRQVIEVPLYADMWFDFFPVWLGDWYNNSVWGFDSAVIRAYDGRP